jgi:hypothetical protein
MPDSPPHNFSVRWTRTLTIDKKGRYRSSLTVDDGLGLFVDDFPVLDEWHDSASTTYSPLVDLDARPHLFRIEYFEHLGLARIKQSEWEWTSDTADCCCTPTPPP